MKMGCLSYCCESNDCFTNMKEKNRTIRISWIFFSFWCCFWRSRSVLIEIECQLLNCYGSTYKYDIYRKIWTTGAQYDFVCFQKFALCCQSTIDQCTIFQQCIEHTDQCTLVIIPPQTKLLIVIHVVGLLNQIQ